MSSLKKRTPSGSRKSASRPKSGVSEPAAISADPDDIYPETEVTEDQLNRRHAIAYCSEGPFSQRLFSGIVDAVAERFRWKEDVGPGPALNGEELRVAILAAIRVYEIFDKDKPGQYDGHELVFRFLMREGLEGSL